MPRGVDFPVPSNRPLCVAVVVVQMLLIISIGTFIFMKTMNISEQDSVLITNVDGQRLATFKFKIAGHFDADAYADGTRKKATKLGVTGYVIVYGAGRINGVAEGTERATAEFRHWLENVGVKHARVESAAFTDYHHISERYYVRFTEKL